MREGPSYLVGLIGHGVQGSLSPALHERAGSRQGYRYMYRLIDLQLLGLDANALPDLLDAAELMGFSGLNITHPCKQAVIPHLDELSEDARSIGAVNTVVFRQGRRIGYNTDSTGFSRAFRDQADGWARSMVVQIGAGGAGAAVAHAMLDLGVSQLLLVDRDRGRAEQLAASLCGRFGDQRAAAVTDLPAALEQAQGVINTTPMGMASHPGMALDADMLKPSQWVAEIVYFPLETQLLREARARGCRTIDGSGMAIYQAAGAFQLFTGVEPDARQMRRDFDELVSARRSRPVEASYAAQ